MAGPQAVSDISNEYQTYFTNKLLDHAVQLLVLDQFATQEPFPKNAGSQAIRFFKKGVADATQVQSLTEGTPMSTSLYRKVALNYVDVTLAQYGEVTSVTDIISWTDKFKWLNQSIETMKEDCALKADQVIRNEIVATNIVDAVARTKRYAGGATSFATLVALTDPTTSGRLVAQDILDCFTGLKILRAPKINGSYAFVTPPQISRDMMNDSKWVNLSVYSKPDQMIKGEVGMLFGCKIVEHTDPFIEKTGGAEGTDSSASAVSGDAVFVSFALGKGAYGTPIMAGKSPWSPKVVMVDTPDHSDPLCQNTLAGYSLYWAAKLYQSNWAITFRSYSGYGV